jgi:gluconate 2-dehydrogenase gamma chain
MDNEDTSRRLFLLKSLTGISSAWLTLRLPEIISAQEHAHHAGQSVPPVAFECFTPEQATEVEAVAAQIIPTDDTPGAREARVIYFIDRALMTFDKDKRTQYESGLKELRAKQKRMFPRAARFSELGSDQQIALLKKIEKTDFFGLVRLHTVMGFFADAEYGGNFNQAGWKLIGFQDRFNFKPPFGFYDRDYKGEQ